MKNEQFCIKVVQLKKELSKRNPTIATILERFMLQVLEQDEEISKISDERIMRFSGIGPATLPVIKSIVNGLSDEEIINTAKEVDRPTRRDTGISGLQNIFYETNRRMKN